MAAADEEEALRMVTERRHSRAGQALMELACGLLAVALVLAALFGLVRYIAESLDRTRSMRAQAGRSALDATTPRGYSTSSVRDSVEVEPFAAEYIFGTRTLRIREEVALPNMRALETVAED